MKLDAKSVAALEVWLTHDTQPRLTATRETAPPL